MKLRALSKDDEKSMLELLRTERNSRDTDFYIDRGNDFWGPYDWFSRGNNIAMGVFSDHQLIGMAAVVQLPFKFKGIDNQPFVATDMLIHPDHRKSFAAARIMTGLHTILPSSGIIELWVENRPNFAEALLKFSTRFGHSTISPKVTNLITIYPNQKKEIQNTDFVFEISNDEDQISNHLNRYLIENDSWCEPFVPENIHKIFRHVTLFKYIKSNVSICGLLLDRGNLQKIRWNGQSRLMIEKYRRALTVKNISFQADDELPFLNLGFVIGSTPALPSDLCVLLANYGFENNYFGINVRDIETNLLSNIDHVAFPRRVFFSVDTSVDDLKRFALINADKKIVLESIFL